MNFDYNVDKQEITVELNSPSITLDTPTGGRGLKGDTGNTGPKGDPGDPGTPGKDGEAATITVGSTTTGDAGTDASVTNSGTTSAAVLDFTIPKGDKGDTGDTGETGNGISSIEKTSTSGLVDTYTIYFTDGTTTTYTVTNGSGGGGSTTDVQINGTSITSGGTANIITEGVYSASTNKIATMSDLSSKQDTLVSGTNIKTINNTSLLGSGNLSLASAWGDITGILSNQTDLQNALDGKEDSITELSENVDIKDLDEGFYKFTDNYIVVTVGNENFTAHKGGLLYIREGEYYIPSGSSIMYGTVFNYIDASREFYYGGVSSSNTSPCINYIDLTDVQSKTRMLQSITAGSTAYYPSCAAVYTFVNNSLPTKVSDLTNDSGFITSTEAGNTYALKSLYGDTTINVGRASSTTVGQYSTAEGFSTTASGDYSHAEGRHTVASGGDSHAEGYMTSASGSKSHAEGDFTFAKGYASHAEGLNTKAGSYYQHVSGKYNIEDTSDTYAEIIGNGTANNARSNARTLDWSGNEVLAGKLTVGTAPTNNMDVATKQYVDNAISGIPAADVYYVPSSDSSSSNPFILENHNPGVYIFEDSSNVYIKVLSTSSTSRLSNSPWAGTGFFLLATPTSEMTDGHIIAQYMSFGIKYPYKNTITFDSNVSYNYDYSSSSQNGLEWVNLLSAQTISGLKTFSTLPQSSVVPSDDKDLANKKYVDDAISGGGGTATDVKINGTSITSNDEADIQTYGTYNASTNKIATMSDLPTVPTNVSAFTNDAGYITSSALSGYATTSDLDDVQDQVDANSDNIISNSNKIGTLANLTTNTKTDLVSAINEVNKKDIITVYVTSTYTASSAADYIPNSLTINSQLGNKLSVSGGNVVIGSGVSKILVSGTAVLSLSGSGSKVRNFSIRKNNTNQKTASENFNHTGWAKISITSALIDVEEGDTIKIQSYLQSGDKLNGGSAYTYITLEVVEYS